MSDRSVSAPARLVNYILYQAGWLAVVAGAGRGRPWAGAAAALALVAVHVALARRRRDEILLAVACGTVGAIVDSIQTALGVLEFHAGQPVARLCPPWILVLWVGLATTLRFSLGWLSGRYVLAALLGLVGGPLAFRAGEAMGAVTFPDRTRALLILAVVWCAAFPLLVRVSDTLRGKEDAGGYRGM